MILFEKIRWKNFLSTGNQYTEIGFTQHPTNLIIGTNGAGKSTLLDALTFSLFGKPFRKINKPQLVNSVNEKDCIVEVEFSIGNTKWKVVRGIKPNIFEIFRDDNALNQSAAALDQQKWFEQNVIKMNYKSFTQIVILGSSTFVPFMQLTATNRRDVIEDLLDIRIFSTMNTLLKDRVKSLKDSIRDHEYKLDMAKERVEMQQRFITDLKEQSAANNAQRQGEITSLRDEIVKVQEMVDADMKLCSELQGQVTQYATVDEELGKLRVFESKFKDKKKTFQRDLKFFKKNDTCPTCKQSITEEFRTSKEATITDSISELEKASVDLQAKIDDITTSVTAKQNLLESIQNLQQEIASNNREVRWKQDAIGKIEESIEKTNGGGANLKREQAKLKEIARDGIEVEKNLSSKKKDRDNHDVITNMLRDTGVKAGIIKRYLPIMNQLINRYLKELDFYVSFELNENFEETIKSRFRDEFSYASFSEGEKMRIDLALLFTWRTIAKMKNSANTNLLILDEIFDSSLDVSGTDDFMKILRAFSEDSNVFVISHKPDAMQDRFESVLVVEKKQNFSTIRYES